MPKPLWETATLDERLAIEDCKVPAIHIPVTHYFYKSHTTSDAALRRLIMQTHKWTPTDVRGDDKQYLVTFGTTVNAKAQLKECHKHLTKNGVSTMSLCYTAKSMSRF